MERLKILLLSKGFRLLSGILLLGYIIYYLFKNSSLLTSIFSISMWYLILLILVWLNIYLITGYKTKILLEIFKIKTTFKEWFGTTVIGAMTNYLLPQSGFVTRASYFKIRKKMPITYFFAAQSADMLLALLSKGLIGLICTLISPFEPKNKFILIAIFLGFMLISLIPFFVQKIIRLSNRNWFIKKIKSFIYGIQLIGQSPKVYWRLIFINFFGSVFYAVWYLLAFRALGYNITFIEALVLGVLLNALMAVQVTPGNLGLQEVVTAAYAAMTKVGFNQGLTVSLLLRGVSILMSFSLGTIFARNLFNINLGRAAPLKSKKN